ncbi:hypothetical protein AGMMS50212_06200 [Spirochaetia bacterium]|nr:hypothetical protein AGMMS50212_06200 [Spirochaetia bacterium]
MNFSIRFHLSLKNWDFYKEAQTLPDYPLYSVQDWAPVQFPVNFIANAALNLALYFK